MISNQLTFNFSPYMAICDMVVLKDNMLRQINDRVDFFCLMKNYNKNIVPTMGEMRCPLFEFNKDAEMYFCQARHMVIRKARTGDKEANQIDTYYFDINLCKQCT